MLVRSALARASIIAVACLTAGCSYLYEPKPVVSKLESQEILSHTASVKNTFVFDRESPLIFCAEPPPDAAFTQTMDIDFSFALVGSGGDSGDEREESAEMEMDGRTPPIMLARELLYRLCEFSKNHQIDTATAIDLYKQNLDIIKGVADKTAENTTLTIGETLSTTETESVTESIPAMATATNNGSDAGAPTGPKDPDDPYAADGYCSPTEGKDNDDPDC
jgi:hypothetical protein